MIQFLNEFEIKTLEAEYKIKLNNLIIYDTIKSKYKEILCVFEYMGTKITASIFIPRNKPYLIFQLTSKMIKMRINKHIRKKDKKYEKYMNIAYKILLKRCMT